jgi:hypothetical protein
MAFKDKSDVNLLMNMHHPPKEGNFCDKCGNALKPAMVQNCNRHMGTVFIPTGLDNSEQLNSLQLLWLKIISRDF